MNSAGLSKRTFFGALVVMATLAVAACGSSSVASTGNNGNGNGNSNSSPSTGTGNGNGKTGGTPDPAVSVPRNFPGGINAARRPPPLVFSLRERRTSGGGRATEYNVSSPGEARAP